MCKTNVVRVIGAGALGPLRYLLIWSARAMKTRI